MGRTKLIADHLQNISRVYPTLASGVTVTSAAGAWTLGAFAEIIPASTITNDFMVHRISVEDISANDVFEITLYCGASDTVCGSVRLTKTAVMDSVLNIPIQTGDIPANSRIRAKVACAGGGAKTVDISVYYHELNGT
jgi:hypothetical protein